MNIKKPLVYVACATLLLGIFGAVSVYAKQKGTGKLKHNSSLLKMEGMIVGNRAFVNKATITAITGNTITAQTTANGLTTTWLVSRLPNKASTNGKTRPSPHLSIGESVRFSGTILNPELTAGNNPPSQIFVTQASISPVLPPRNFTLRKPKPKPKPNLTPNTLPDTASSTPINGDASATVISITPTPTPDATSTIDGDSTTTPFNATTTNN